MLKLDRSRTLLEESSRVFPGGVNSPVRAFKGVKGQPPFIKKGVGPYLWDEDENSYIDFVGSWGTAILGHGDKDVVASVQEAATAGLSFGAPTKAETALGLIIQEALPSIERLRLVSSGTEACMSAIRVARAFRKRDKIIKFTGCYHGHADMLLVQAGSGVATFGLPDSPGVPKETAAHTLVVPYNDPAALEKTFFEHGSDIAAVILEPIIGNAGFIRPKPEFLQAIQDLCKKCGALLIFDEVMTGFRVAWGGAQQLFRIKPDLTTLGKVIGGGLPLAAFGGRADIMDQLAPSGAVYQAGTLSGNPVAVACGRATLDKINRTPNAYRLLHERSGQLTQGFKQVAAKAGISMQVDWEGGMFGFFFHNHIVSSYEEAKKSQTSTFIEFFHGMLQRGIYLAPSAFEAGFVSLAHSPDDIRQAIEKAELTLRSISSGGKDGT